MGVGPQSSSRREWGLFRRTGIGCSASCPTSEPSRTTAPGWAGVNPQEDPGTPERSPRISGKRLIAAGIEPPYVLAGHSFGGLPVRAFADLYPELTAGLVLVDASHPDQWARWPVRNADRILAASQRLLSVLAWFGVLRALDASRAISSGLPAEQVAQLRAAAALPQCAATEAAQTRAWETSRNQLNAAGPLGELPLTVLAVTDQPVGGDLLTALQLELAGLTEKTRFEIVDGASHESLVSQRMNARTSRGGHSFGSPSGRGSSVVGLHHGLGSTPPSAVVRTPRGLRGRTRLVTRRNGDRVRREPVALREPEPTHTGRGGSERRRSGRRSAHPSLSRARSPA